MSCETASCSPSKRRRIPGPAGHPYWKLQNHKETQDLVEKKEEEKQEEDGITNYISLSGRITTDKIPLESPELWKGPWLSGCFDNNIQIIAENNKLYLIKNNHSNLFKNNIKSITLGENRIKHVFKIKELMVLLKSLTIYSDGIGEVIDCFGSMKATFTKSVLKDFNDIRSGSCLILENITIYQSSHYNFYLNITSNNIAKTYKNSTKIPIHLKLILKTFHKKLGIKNNINIKKKNKKNKNNNLISKNMNNNYNNSLKINKKRKYSDIADSPWLITSNNNTFKNKIMEISDSDSDDNKPIMSNKENNTSQDLIILSNQKNKNEKEENNDSDDDIIIKDMDMNETPKGTNINVNPLECKDINNGNDANRNENNGNKNNNLNGNKRKYKRKFSFKNCKKKKKNNVMNKDKSKSPSIWSKHYENKEVNMFENVNENNEIPKGTDLINDLFAGFDDGFAFPND